MTFVKNSLFNIEWNKYQVRCIINVFLGKRQTIKSEIKVPLLYLH